MDKNTGEYCVMNETGKPYENDECPFSRTKEDDEAIRHILEKHGLKIGDDTNDDLV